MRIHIIDILILVPVAGNDTWLERNIGLLAALAVLLLFGLGIFWMIRTSRRRSAQRLERAKSLGFEPLEVLDQAVLQRLNRLYRANHRQELDPRNVFVQHRNDAAFYLMDIVDVGGDESSDLGEDVVVIVSPYLSLPRFSLAPMLKMDGRMGGLMNKAVDRLMDMVGTRQGLVRVPFDQYPEIDDNYIIFGSDPNLLQNFFTSSYMSGFFNIKPKYEITAGGDTLVVKAIFPDREKSRDEIVRSQYDDAEAMFRFLSQ
jgi:hypothetical protein